MENEKLEKIFHDLNNLLCASSGFTELLLDREDREYQKKLLTHNRQGLIKMSELLEQTQTLLYQEMYPEDIDEDDSES